ncbi:MAG: DHH family phosphoesterase [Anaerolineae bacterium]|nr:DHH family phosphoesterase [Anaerolineae bacterium]
MKETEGGGANRFASGAEALDALLKTVRGAESVLIVTHDYPDPDAIGSAVALAFLLNKRLGLGATLAHGGVIGRAENKAMVRLLSIEMKPLYEVHPEQYDVVALVDAQPGAGNLILPADSIPTVVIDHHAEARSKLERVPFIDIRPGYGATSTMLTGYLRAARLVPDGRTPTALFYGIKSDTMGLARAASDDDVEAYLYLLPLADTKILGQIENAQVPLDYFRAFERALERTFIYDDVVVCDLGPMDWPDLAAEMADFLLRWEGACWVLCSGVYAQEIVVSVRTTEVEANAGRVVQDIVEGLGTGGGHGLMAGGRVLLNDKSPAGLARQLCDRFLESLGRTKAPREKLV